MEKINTPREFWGKFRNFQLSRTNTVVDCAIVFYHKTLSHKNHGDIALENQGYRELEFENITFNYEVSFRVDSEDPEYNILFKKCVFKKVNIFTPSGAIKQSAIKINFLHSKISDFYIDVACLSSLFFETAVIENIHAKNVQFINVTSFKNCTLGTQNKDAVTFKNSEFKTSLLFKDCNFSSAPDFHGARLHEDTKLVRCNFKDYSEYAEGSYRLLRKFFETREDNLTAKQLHYHELKSASKNSSMALWDEKVISFFYWAFSFYGTSFFMPILWLLTLFSIGFYINTELLGIYCESHTGSPKWVQNSICTSSVNTALYLSLQASLGPIGLILTEKSIGFVNFLGNILHFLHSVLSSIIWFLLIMSIRRRFKMD
jgi:hypothetical protein